MTDDAIREADEELETAVFENFRAGNIIMRNRSLFG
jgi:hypothetical protein